MERRWIDYLVTAIAAAVAAYAKENFFRAPGREFLAYGISIAAGLLAFQLLNLLRYLLDRGLRLDPRFGYLGFWIEEALGEASSYCTLFEVKHDPLTNRFSVEGNTFHTETTRHYADFFSVAVSFPENNRMYYLHKAKILGRNGEITGLTPSISLVPSGFPSKVRARSSTIPTRSSRRISSSSASAPPTSDS